MADAFHQEIAQLRCNAPDADSGKEIRLGDHLAAEQRLHDLALRSGFSNGARNEFIVVRRKGNEAFAVHIKALRERSADQATGWDAAEGAAE